MVRCRACESGAFVAGGRFPRGITSFAPGYAATAIARTVVTPMPRRNAWQRTKRGLQPGGGRNEAGGLSRRDMRLVWWRLRKPASNAEILLLRMPPAKRSRVHEGRPSR